MHLAISNASNARHGKELLTEGLVVEEARQASDSCLLQQMICGLMMYWSKCNTRVSAILRGKLIWTTDVSNSERKDVFAETGGYSTAKCPSVLGHEGAGIIRGIGPEVRDTSLRNGQSIILSFNHCSSCRQCSSGHPASCSQFEALNITGKRLADQTTPAKLLDGRRLECRFFGQPSFLRLSAVSQHSIVPCPYPENLTLYASLGCGFQTGGGTIINALDLGVDDSLVIIGAGTVGLAAIMAAKYKNIKQIITVDIIEDKISMAESLGATHTVNSKSIANAAAEISRLTNGGARFAIDCTGVPSLIQTLLDCVCCGGTAVLAGAPPKDLVLNIDPTDLLHANKTLRGISQGDSVPTEVCMRGLYTLWTLIWLL